MTTQEREPILVTLGDKTTPFSADVLLHYYHIDGSRTILLKTSPRKSVSDFITSELTATENHEHLFISNETEVPPRNATPEELANSNRNDPLFGKAFTMTTVCYEALEAYRFAQDYTYKKQTWQESTDKREALLQNMIDYISNNHFECELKDNEFLFFFQVADSLLNKL